MTKVVESSTASTRNWRKAAAPCNKFVLIIHVSPASEPHRSPRGDTVGVRGKHFHQRAERERQGTAETRESAGGRRRMEGGRNEARGDETAPLGPRRRPGGIEPLPLSRPTGLKPAPSTSQGSGRHFQGGATWGAASLAARGRDHEMRRSRRLWTEKRSPRPRIISRRPARRRSGRGQEGERAARPPSRWARSAGMRGAGARHWVPSAPLFRLRGKQGGLGAPHQLPKRPSSTSTHQGTTGKPAVDPGQGSRGRGSSEGVTGTTAGAYLPLHVWRGEKRPQLELPPALCI